MQVFDNRVLRRIFGPKSEEVTGSGENYVMRNLVIFIFKAIPLQALTGLNRP